MYKGLRNPTVFMNFLTGSRFVRSRYAAALSVFVPLDPKRYEFAYRDLKMR
jgi:hypothetical protein